ATGDAAPQPSAKPSASAGLGQELRALLVPFVPGALLVVGTFFVYQQSADRHVAAMNVISGSEAGRVEQEVQRGLDVRAAALERLAASYAEGGDAWRGDAN